MVCWRTGRIGFLGKYTRLAISRRCQNIPPLEVFVIALLIGKIIVRLGTKSWKLKRQYITIIISISFFLLAAAIFILLGSSSLIEFAWILAISGLVLLSLFLLFFHIGRTFILKRFSEKKWIKIILSFVWSLIINCRSEVRNDFLKHC